MRHQATADHAITDVRDRVLFLLVETQDGDEFEFMLPNDVAKTLLADVVLRWSASHQSRGFRYLSDG